VVQKLLSKHARTHWTECCRWTCVTKVVGKYTLASRGRRRQQWRPADGCERARRDAANRITTSSRERERPTDRGGLTMQLSRPLAWDKKRPLAARSFALAVFQDAGLRSCYNIFVFPMNCVIVLFSRNQPRLGRASLKWYSCILCTVDPLSASNCTDSLKKCYDEPHKLYLISEHVFEVSSTRIHM